MSEAKFTKGEWVLVESDFGDEMEVTSEQRLENSKGNICSMNIYFDGEHGIEQQANAHLIAAAPDMYEVIDKISGLLSKHEEYTLEWIEMHTGCLQELLAKARGDI